MIYFFNSYGQITRAITAPLDEAAFNAQEDEQWFCSEEVVRGDEYYRLGNSLVQFPQKPSSYHEWDWQTLTWVLPSSAVAAARANGAQQIDAAAGKARQRYITTVPGQDATYIVKYQEALDYIAAGYPNDLTSYPYIAGESSPNTWMTATQAATRIAVLGGYWRDVIGPAIEKARVNGKDAIDALTSIEEIDAHVAAVIATLEAI